MVVCVARGVARTARISLRLCGPWRQQAQRHPFRGGRVARPEIGAGAGSDHLDGHRHGFAAADAQRGHAALAAAGRSAPTRVAIRRAPEAPIGWPRAVAPWTLTLSCGSLKSVMAAMVTTAKASLISYRSTSSAFQPVLANRFFSAPGAVVNQFGSCECWLWATMRASLTPSFSAVDARISTMAAAPSEIDEELAAVTVPSFLKAGFRVGIFSGMALGPRRCRSRCRPCGRPR